MEMSTSKTKVEGQDLIRHQIMWNRLIAVVEEQAQALLRTAFGAVAREAGDLSAGIYDLKGRMLAQAVTGTPGHVNTMAAAVQHFFSHFPLESMQPGDVYVTNDPWLGTGHLFDFVVVTPVFRDGTLAALIASTCHTVDVGGVGFAADANSVFEEGICIPHLRVRRRGVLNEEIFAIIKANTRNPIEVEGDILSLISCNDVGGRRLLEMLAEFSLENIEELGEYILETSRQATREAIRRLPSGTYSASMVLDGYECPVEVKATMKIDDGHVIVNYQGSSDASIFGINSPKCYTDAYTVYGLKCVIAPEIPNNAGSLEPFEIRAPAGTIVNPLRPSPVTARHVVGQMLPDLMFGCLEDAMDGAVPAESAGSIWVLALSNNSGTRENAFNTMAVGLGGMGARPECDGMSTVAFPSGVGGIPIEITEADAPVVIWKKEFIADSGGAGRQRGGLGQRIEIGGRFEQELRCSAATFDRRQYPARGRQGGNPGRAGSVEIISAANVEMKFDGKGMIEVPQGGRLRVELPGGGGFGDPEERPSVSIESDLKYGFVTPEAARSIYRHRTTR